MKSIKLRLVVYFSIIILISSTTIGIISVRSSSKAVTTEAEHALSALAFEGARLTESRIETQQQVLETIALSMDIRSMEWELQRMELIRQAKEVEFIDMAVVYPDGTAYIEDGSIIQLGDRQYVKDAFADKHSAPELTMDRATDELSLLYATPIKRDGKIVGVLTGRRDGYTLSDIIDDTGFGENGYGYIINSEGTTIAHPNRELVLAGYNSINLAEEDESLRSLADLVEEILGEKSGVSDYNFDGHDMYAGYSPVEGTDWTLVITANSDEVLGAIPKLRNNIILAASTMMLISIIITYIIGHLIAKPIVGATAYSEVLANYDITQDLPESLTRRKDEIGGLGRSIQSVVDNLRYMVNEIRDYSEQLAATSEEMTATTHQSATAAEEVSRTAEEIAIGASDQAMNTEAGSHRATVLGDQIEKNLGYMENLNTASSEVIEVIKDGLIDIENLSTITEESNKASKEIHQVILKTNDSSIKIAEASNLIASIAEQTNLLALNAAIEAARAGETGRGFAVVAEEIRKLAEQSSDSTLVIDEIVNDLQANSNDAVDKIEIISNIAKQQTSGVASSREKYVMIDKAMQGVSIETNQLDISGVEMEKMKDEILDTLQNLSAIAEENSAATEEVTASMEEQSASMEEIAGASDGLSDLAQRLQSIIMRFKI